LTEISLILAGLFNLGFAIFYFFFSRFFRWEQDLTSLHQHNRALTKGMNWALTVVLFAYLLFFQSSALTSFSLGRDILIGIGLLWATRAIMQLTIFGSRGFTTKAITLLSIFGATLHGVPTFS